MWGLTFHGKVLDADNDRAELLVRVFRHPHAITKIRGSNGKRNNRMNYGYKVRELTEAEQKEYASRPVQERPNQYLAPYVRTEEGGRIGRVVQTSPQDHQGDSEPEV